MTKSENVTLSQNVDAPIPIIYEYDTLNWKKTLEMRLTLLLKKDFGNETREGGIILDYLGWYNLITWVLKSRDPFLAVVRGRCETEEKSESCNFTGFENGGRRLWTKECGWPLEAGNVKEIDFPLESLGRNEMRPVSDF